MNSERDEFEDGEEILTTIDSTLATMQIRCPNIYLRNVIDPYTYFSDEAFKTR